MKHKNQQSSEMPDIRMKKLSGQLSQPGNIQTMNSNEFQQVALPGTCYDQDAFGSQTQRLGHRRQESDALGRAFGMPSSSRAHSMNRNEFTAHLNSARGQGACRESSNAFRS